MKQILCCLPLLGLMLQKAASQSHVLNIDPGKTVQSIHNFAASDAWSCQFVGNWQDSKRNQMADWLFSMDTTASGQPRGIGLSMWRFNIGAGSAEQGDSSGIRDVWRRAESFFGPNQDYDWNKQAGQRWFLQAAKERGVKQFLGFLNSPPVAFTRNGKAFAYKGKCNIAPEQYQAAADYITAVVQGIRRTMGITFNFISPVNEPQWDWSDGGQEGCPYDNDEIAGFTKAIAKTFQRAKLPTQLLLTEAGQLNYLYSSHGKAARGQQIETFFGKGAPEKVYKGIAGHSYFTTSPEDTAIAIRKRVAAALKGIEFWQSEYCILGDNAGEINGGGRDLGMDAALYIARVIHTDLAVANASAWQWWLAISPYQYKDGLIYVDKQENDGEIHDSKMLWAFGNYSRFIRPGAKRVMLSDEENTGKDIRISAFVNTNRQLCIVIINSGNRQETIDIRCKGLKKGNMRSYTTNSEGNLQPGFVNGEAVIPARAVVTLTGNIQ
ncbi:O-Glycosyl hydrolase [Chitinophaga terrae (ex Kim and Jung 2007)]|uniref:O-Glycosyl hydrolase n=1 Tax=Chitinophaga terrae (ex Kim and Jung 2007) TaxID=408074 RepID=A0A1H3X233_9BACT|nr:glycoside hydrolase [Chitinophaga terrae (ex Kim and Jung 2007)]SDZ92694.1 O-Glycosyl hydrolase [Chitinophaga terrae (ex Kim and Jung 2007)]